MEQQFQAVYSEFLNIEKAKNVISETSFGNQKGIRIDRLLEVSLLENSVEVSRNSGKTLMLETLYKYKKCDPQGNDYEIASASDTHSSKSASMIRSRGQNVTEQSVVFRPQQRQEDYIKSKDIVYRNCYRFDLLKSR